MPIDDPKRTMPATADRETGGAAPAKSPTMGTGDADPLADLLLRFLGRLPTGDREELTRELQGLLRPVVALKPSAAPTDRQPVPDLPAKLPGAGPSRAQLAAPDPESAAAPGPEMLGGSTPPAPAMSPSVLFDTKRIDEVLARWERQRELAERAPKPSGRTGFLPPSGPPPAREDEWRVSPRLALMVAAAACGLLVVAVFALWFRGSPTPVQPGPVAARTDDRTAPPQPPPVASSHQPALKDEPGEKGVVPIEPVPPLRPWGEPAGGTIRDPIRPPVAPIDPVPPLPVRRPDPVGKAAPAPPAPGPDGAWTNTIGMRFRRIPKGKFEMGSPSTESGRQADEGPVHWVEITKGFWLGETEVTQEQWKKLFPDNRSKWEGDDRPVEMVSWEEANDFCKRLSRQEGRSYRLPTEAEWEYACRAGTRTAFHWGNDGGDGDGQFDARSPVGKGRAGRLPLGTSDVKAFPPNAWGLYDMHGNVSEWCGDWCLRRYAERTEKDPSGPNSGIQRTARGGSWADPVAYCRSADRGGGYPDGRNDRFGFRVLLEE